MKISGALFILVLFVSLAKAQSIFEIKSPDKKINFAPLPEKLMKIIEKKGLVNFMKE